MPIANRIVALKLIGRKEPWFVSPDSDELRVQVELESGRGFALALATPDIAALRLKKSGEGFLADPRVISIAKADEQTVGEAVVALAADMSGYWVRRYSIDGPKAKAAEAPEIARVEFANGVAEVFLSDKRQFSILTSTPARWQAALRDGGLRFYFGPPILFVDALQAKNLRAAVQSIAQRGDAELCLFDTPRRTLPEVLSDFKTRHFSA